MKRFTQAKLTKKIGLKYMKRSAGTAVDKDESPNFMTQKNEKATWNKGFQHHAPDRPVGRPKQ